MLYSTPKFDYLFLIHSVYPGVDSQNALKNGKLNPLKIPRNNLSLKFKSIKKNKDHKLYNLLPDENVLGFYSIIMQ